MNRIHQFITVAGVVLSCEAFGVVASGTATADESRTNEALTVLSKTRKVYSTLRDYRLERETTISESKNGHAAELAKLTFATSSADVGNQPASDSILPANSRRLRLEIRGSAGRLLLVANDESSVWYSSREQIYVKGHSLGDVIGTIPGSMLMMFHMMPFAALHERTLHKVTMSRKDTLAKGTHSHECYVLEGLIPHADRLAQLKRIAVIQALGGRSPRPPFIGVDGIVVSLQAQGIIGEHGPVDNAFDQTRAYSARQDLTADDDDGSFPVRVSFWIDAKQHLIRRTVLTQTLYKHSVDGNGRDGAERVDVVIADDFVAASVNSDLPDEHFAFSPPSGAKEVPLDRPQ